MRQLRILSRVAVEMALGLKQSGWSNWLVIGILAVALTVFGGILQLTMTMKGVVASWGSKLEISAYLKDDADSALLARQISHIQGIKQVEVVSKEVAWKEMQTKFKVAGLNNPLPNTLHIKLIAAEDVELLAARVKAMTGVEEVRYPLEVARTINRFRHILEIAGVVITTALTAATLMVISNTIGLVIQHRHREIEILSLMGVSPWYIKGPLVLQGAFYGAVSAIAAVAVIWGVHQYLDAYVTGQMVSYMPLLVDNIGYGMMPTFMVLLLLGIAVGGCGSYFTSSRYIKI